ncbi:MAG: hypothetical protein DVB25_09215 [Verrucomicrobia bacterium]|nr:MAG: hypothetical protein DVB25_09215 [Verrucomicrobiota bacterium]
MKAKIALLLIATAISASASVTIVGQYGVNYTSALTPIEVPNGSLWALVVSSDGTFGKTGTTFGANGFITTAIANATFTAGQSLSLGAIAGTSDSVFAMGTFDSSLSGMLGLAAPTSILTLGTNGVAAGKDYAFFFFPGGTLSGGTGTIGSQAGAYNTTIADAGNSLVGMVIPSEGGTVTAGAADPSALSGTSLTQTAFKAVNLVPEPSAALLGALGALGLLRRRRI